MSILILLTVTILLIFCADKQSFWFDELDWTIGKIDGHSLSEMLSVLLSDGYNLPLYYVILYPLYQLFSSSDTILMLPSIFFLIMGIWLLGVYGKRVFSKKIGFIVLCVASISPFLLEQGGTEIRPYSIGFCMLAWMMLCHFERTRQNSYKNNLLYGISVFFLLFCHWFCAIIVSFYFLADVYLWHKKQISARFLLAYLIATPLFIFWFIWMLYHLTTDLSTFVGAYPSLREFLILTVRIFGATRNNASIVNFAVMIVPLMAFIVGCIVAFAPKVRKKLIKNDALFYVQQQLFICLFYFALIFIYSRFINSAGSVFHPKYFFFILPQIFLIISLGAYHFIHIPIVKKTKILFVLIPLYTVLCFYGLLTTVHSIRQPYKEVAIYLSADQRAYDENTLIISSVGQTWVLHYFENKGISLPSNVASGTRYPYLFLQSHSFIDSNIMDMDKILTYERLMLFQVDPVYSKFSEEFLDFVLLHYQKVGEHASLGISIYELRCENYDCL
jgi:hypothetical protein